MAKTFYKLTARMPKQARGRARARTRAMAAELTLAQLRRAFDVSQEELAEILDVKQANVSKIERREDIRLSTLVAFVRAIGGDIEIIARFPNRAGGKDKSIKLKPFY
jgi:DNA-binding Xre family transcriptional regulator